MEDNRFAEIQGYRPGQQKKAHANNGYVYFATLKPEENRAGPQRHKLPPSPCPQFDPLPKRLSSPDDSKAMTCNGDLLISRMKPKK